MSYANGTTHYNLPQTTGTDKRDWSDTNQAFQDVDAALYQATQDTAKAELDIDALEVRMDTAEQNIADNAGDIAALDGRLTTAEGTITQHTVQIADVRRDAEDMICAYNEASATSTHAYAVDDYFIYNDVLYKATASIGVGDTIVPDINCTTTNVATELLALTPIQETVYTVHGDGVKTMPWLLTELFNLIVNNIPTLLTKVANNSCDIKLVVTLPLKAFTYHLSSIESDGLSFYKSTINYAAVGADLSDIVLTANVTDSKWINTALRNNVAPVITENTSAVIADETISVYVSYK